MTSRFCKVLVNCSLLIGFSGCTTTGPTTQTSLYDRLGGKTAIQAVVSDFIDMVGADTRIQNKKVGARLSVININELKGHLVDQVCVAAGGPCTYTGRDMKSSHKGLGITEAEFNYVVDDLVKTLDKYKVPTNEKSELLALLGPMKNDIVEIP